MLFQKVKIHSGLPVKTMNKALRNHEAEVFIACSVLAQKDKMVWIVVNSMDTILHFSPGHINLTANNGLNPGGFGGLVKIDTAIHDTMVGDGNGLLPQLLHPLHHGVDPAGTVQKTVLGMNMKMNKTHTVTSLDI